MTLPSFNALCRVRKLKEDAVRELLARLITALDDDDQDDAHGTEGWRTRYGFEGEL